MISLYIAQELHENEKENLGVQSNQNTPHLDKYLSEVSWMLNQPLAYHSSKTFNKDRGVNIVLVTAVIVIYNLVSRGH